MKLPFWILLPCACLFASCEIPNAVGKSFHQKYPQATEIEWGERKMNGQYDVRFKLKEEKMEATFESDGTWLRTSSELAENNWPVTAHLAMLSTFPGYEILATRTLQTPTFPAAFEMDIEHQPDFEILVVVISDDGQVLQQAEMQGEDDGVEW